MIVRLAREDELAKGLQLCDAFAKEEKFRAKLLEEKGIKYDRAISEESIATLVANKTVFVMIEEGIIIGVMVGMIAKSFFSNDLMYQSYLFWIDKKHRRYIGKFLKSIENILSKTNISQFVVSNLDIGSYDKLNRFYAMKGFKRLETHFVRTL